MLIILASYLWCFVVHKCCRNIEPFVDVVQNSRGKPAYFLIVFKICIKDHRADGLFRSELEKRLENSIR